MNIKKPQSGCKDRGWNTEGIGIPDIFKVSWLGFTAKELTKAWAKLGNLDAVGSSCPGVVRLKGSPISLELLPTEMGLCSNTI